MGLGYRIFSGMKYLGLAAILVGWITIATAIAFNPWFSLSRNALSDLGAIGVRNAWIFNSGLIIAGVLALLYSMYLLLASRSRLGILASSIFFLSAIHLILIGLFPEGTYPHLFVSIEFFTLAGLAVLFYGIALLAERIKAIGAASILLAAAGFSGAILIPWPSIGLLEVYAICLLTIWIVLMLKCF